MDSKTFDFAYSVTSELTDEQIISLIHRLMKEVGATGVILTRDDYERETFGPDPTVDDVRAADLRWRMVRTSTYWTRDLPDRMYEAIVDDLGRWPL